MEEKQLRSLLSNGYVIDNNFTLLKKLKEILEKNRTPYSSNFNITNYGYKVYYIQRKVWDLFEIEDKEKFPLTVVQSSIESILKCGDMIPGEYYERTENGSFMKTTSSNSRRLDYSCIIFYGPITYTISDIECDNHNKDKKIYLESWLTFLEQREEKIIRVFDLTLDRSLNPVSSPFSGKIGVTNKGSILLINDQHLGEKLGFIFTNVTQEFWKKFILPDWFINISIEPLLWWYKLIIPFYAYVSYNKNQYPRYNGCVIMNSLCQMITNFSENNNKNEYLNTSIALPNDYYKNVVVYSEMSDMRINYPNAEASGRTLPSTLYSEIYSKEKDYLYNLFLNKTQISFKIWKDMDEKVVWSYTSPVYKLPNSSSYTEQVIGGDFIGITNKGNIIFIQGNEREIQYDVVLYKIVSDDIPIAEWFIDSCVNPLFTICSSALEPIIECQSSNTPFQAPFCTVERRDHTNILLAILCEMLKQYTIHFKRENFTYTTMKNNKDPFMNHLFLILATILCIFAVSIILYMIFCKNITKKSKKYRN